MTGSTNGVADTAVQMPSGAEGSNGKPEVAGDAVPRTRRFRLRRFDETMVHDAVHQATDQLSARIAELEAQLARRDAELEEARSQVPDLESLSNADLAVLASDAAASILRVARTEADAASTRAEKLVADAQAEATRRLEEAEREAADVVRSADEQAASTRAEAEAEIQAKREASDAAIDEAAQQANREAAELAAEAQAYSKQVSTEADSYAERVRGEAEEYSTRVRGEAAKRSEEVVAEAQEAAESLVADAGREAEARVARAQVDAEHIVQAAVDRREALFADLEVQRRLVQSTLEDAAAIQASFVEGYGRLRKTLDESVAHLIEPVQRARRQMANIDRELAERDRV